MTETNKPKTPPGVELVDATDQWRAWWIARGRPEIAASLVSAHEAREVIDVTPKQRRLP